jgi:hypothetical protein
MPKKVIDYSKTIIYKIVSNDLNITETYVGHTTNFVKRKWEHKNRCYDKTYDNIKVYKTIRDNGGWDNWTMLEICKYPCNSFHEAALEERKHYELLNANLNMYNPSRTHEEWYEGYKEKKKEYDKQRRITHKNTIKEKQKIWGEKYRDKLLEGKKKWYSQNRDRILENHKQKYTCCCGSISTIAHKLRHEKSQKHIVYLDNQLKCLSLSNV